MRDDVRGFGLTTGFHAASAARGKAGVQFRDVRFVVRAGDDAAAAVALKAAVSERPESCADALVCAGFGAGGRRDERRYSGRAPALRFQRDEEALQEVVGEDREDAEHVLLLGHREGAPSASAGEWCTGPAAGGCRSRRPGTSRAGQCGPRSCGLRE